MTSDAPKIYRAQSSSTWIWIVALLLFALLMMGAGGMFAAYFLLGPVRVPHAEPVVEPHAVVTPSPPAPSPPAVESPQPDSPLAVVDSHRVLHLPLLNSLDDASAKQQPVVVKGSVQKTAQGAHFSGDGWLEAPHIALDNRPFAIALWVWPQGKVANMGLFQQLDTEKNNRYLHLMLRDPDGPRFGFYINDLQVDKPVTMERGWTHLVFQYTGWEQQVWMNGVMAGSRKCVAYKGEAGVTQIGKVPGWDNPPTQNFRGFMRDLRIYDVALSAVQIKALNDLKAAAPAPRAAPADPGHRDDAF